MNPLSFSIGVKDEASKQIEAINKELNNLVSKLDSIKNIAISLGGDPGEAESLMKSLNGVAASLANISRLSPEAQAASDKLTASQKELNEAMEQYNNLLAKIKSVNPTQVSEAFQKATKAAQSSMGVNFDRTAPGKFGDLSGLDPTKWAENLTQYLHKSLGTEQIEVNVRRLIANIRHIMASELSGLHKGPSLAPILEESFNFNSVNEKLNNAFRILREEFIKGMKQLQEVEGSKEGLGLVEKALPGLKAKVEAAQKEFETLKNVTSSTPINPEAFKGAEGAIAATNEATKMLGEAINKLDFSKINTALDQLAERLGKLVTELEGIEGRMKTAFTGALEANVKSLGDVIDGLAKKMAAMSAPMSEGMKQGEQATNAQTEAIKKQEGEIAKLQEAKDKLTNQKHEFKDIEEMAEAYKKVEKQVEAVWNVINKFGNIGDKVSGLFMSGKDEFTKSLMHGDTGAFNKAIAHWKMDLSDVLTFLKEPGGSPGLGSAGERLESYISELKRMYEVLRDASSYGKRLMGSQTDPAAEQELRRRIELVEQLKTAYKETYSAVSKGGKAFIEYAHDDLYVEQAAGNAKKKAQVEKELIEIDNQLAASQQKLNELRSQSSTSAEKQTQSEQQQAQATKELGQNACQTAEQLQKLAQSTVGEAFNQLAASLNKIKELFDNLGKAEGLTQLNNTINGVNTAVEALAKTLSNVNNAIKFTGSTEEIASYEAKVKSLQEQVAALEAKAKGLGETAKAASEQVKTVTASGGSGSSSKEGLTERQLKQVNNQLELLDKRLKTIKPAYDAAEALGFKDEAIKAKIKYLEDYKKALDEAVKAGSYSGIKVGEYSLFSKAAGEDIPTQAQAQKMAKQMQEYIAIQQQAQAEAERQAQAQERMRQAAEAAGMSIVKAGDQTKSAGQQSETAKQQMHGFNEEILVNMRSWEMAGKMMAVLEKRIFAVMAQLQSGKALGFDTGSLQTDIQELMRFYAIMKEIRNNYGFANIEGAMLTTSKVLKESGLDFGQMWEKNKQELTAVKTIYEQMMRLKPMADFQNTLPSANLNPKYQEEALANAKQAAEIMKWLQGSDLRKATAFVGGQDYKEATAGIEAFFRAYNQNANIAKSQTAELQRLLEKIQGTDKGGGWISVMKSAGVSEEKINEMRQLAQKIETAIRTLEQNRQMGTAANYVRSDEYRATVIEGKKANDTGYLAVREAHEQAAAEREAAKAIQESAKAAEKKREEMSKAWREQEAARQKEAAAVESSMQKQMAAEEKARQKSIEDAWKAADQFAKAKQEEAVTAAKTAAAKTKEEVKGYDEQIGKLYELERAMSKRFASEQEAQRQYNTLLEQTKALKDRILAAEDKAKTVGADTSVLSGAWMKAYNFQEKLQGISEKDQKTAYRVGALEEEYKKLAQALTQAAKEQEKLNAATEKAQKKSNDDRAKEIQREETNTRRLAGAYQEAQNALDRLESAGTKGMGLGLDVSSVERAMAAIEAWKNTLSQFSNTSDSHAVTELIGNLNVLKRAANETAKAQEQMNVATEKANKEAQRASQKAAADAAKQSAQAAKDAQKENEKWATSYAKAGEEANKLGIKIRDLNRVEKQGSEAGVDTSKLRAYIQQLEAYKGILDSIAAKYKTYGHTDDWLSGKQQISGYDTLGNTARLANEASAAVQRLTAEKQKAASSANQLTAEEQRLAQALNQTAESARGQSQVLSDLKMMATQYLGVWGGQQFLHNIIEIGGQLEMQRMSIGAILQNQSQANDLFEKIKGLAIQSPFGVVELDQMTKQLTAYGFKYSELFDMTKRLADISAATGTGVDRLALALGHVRSEAALSGYTLRQFSMGNVPLLQKLSEKLGKTTQEIRKMVRAKEISYEDVEGVIKDLTNEGGMFYNMQETISQSVKARFKNVKDAMAIMYGEMAESGMGDVLKSVADALMEITKNWKDVATVMGTGVAVWAAQRAAILAYTSLIGKETAATFASIGANVKKQGSMLQLANKYRVLTTAERDLMNASRANSAMIRLRTMLGMNYTKAQGVYIAAQRTIITNTLTQSLSEGKLTIAELAHMVATRKLSHEEARLIIMNSSLDASMKAQMLSIIGSTRRLGVLEMAYRRVGMAIKSLMGSLAAFAPMVIISGLMELWQRNSREMERAQEVADNVYERSQEALKNTRTMMQETDIKSYWRKDKDSKWEDVSGNFGGQIGGERKIVLPSIDTSNAQEAIEKWSQYIKDYAATPNSILNNALFDTKENVRSLEEQFDNLKHKVVEVADAQVLLQGLSSSFEDALKRTNGGWFDDDLITNIEDYNKSLKEFGKNVSSVYKSYRKSIDIAIKSARQQDDAFDKAVQSMGTYAQQFEFLVKNQEDYTNAVKAFKEAGGANAFSEVNESGNFLQNKYYKTTFDEVKEQQKTMEADMNRFFITMDEELERKGYKIGQMTVAQQQAVLLGFKTQFEGLKLSSQESLDYLMDLVSQHYGIELDVRDELFRAKVDEATRLLNGLVNGEWKVDLNFATNINDVIDKARKNYKTAKEYFENAKPIMMKFGVNASFGKEIPLMKMTEILNGIQDKGAKDFVEQVMKGWNEAAKAIQQSIDASTKGGFSLEDPNKSKKNKNKSGSKKSYKDPDVERWKERMKNLKAAYDEYEKLEKEFGHDEAILRVKRAFKGLIDEKDIDNIKEYRKELVEIKNKALDRYNLQKKDKSKDYGKQAQQLAREAEKAINDIDLGEQKRRSDEYLSKLKLQLDELKKQWETFNKVRMATNNEEIAAQVAGLSQDQVSKRDIANSVKANIQGIIKEMGGEVKVPIKFDVTSSDKDIENNVKAALGGSEKYREQIKGITEAIKTWRDLERDAMQKSVDAYTQAVSKAMDYESQLARINAELAEQNRLIDQNNNLSQEQKDRAKSINQANASMKALEASDSYKRFFNGIFGETQTELKGMENTIKAELNYSLEKGAITAEDYAKKIKDIDDVMKQSEISDPDKWYNKGIFNTESMEQRNQRLYGEGNEKYQEGADVFQNGVESGDEAMQKAGQEMMKNGQKMMDGAKGAAQTMAIIDKVIHGIDQSIQGTAKAFDYLKDALDALGVESDTMSTVGDYLHTLGEMSSHVTQSWDNFKSGNFVGAGVEAIGAVTSVIKGISQAHDNRLERAITKLREDVKAIEANTELIAKARERTLGYDMGDVRRQMAQQYAPQSYGGSGIMAYINAMLAGSRQNKSMYDYYSQNSQGTGYQQEYDNLIEQREKYLEILKDQQDKKKKSNDEIEETKAKIAELDDQIAYFTQDLAKELWSIDIKGWADQLSDALASAFENGENMAKAYRDTVTQIIQQMMQKMMQLAILEPRFERLQKQLFGENGKGGVFDTNNPKGSMSKVTAMIADFFGKGGEGEKAITASMEFMTAFQRGMQNAGLTVLNEASNTLSSSMQGTTEETSGLLAGYVNALRQDVSVNRILLTQFVSQMWPDYIETFASQVTAVQNIDTNVQIIMTMMQTGNGAMFNEIAAMRARIDNVVMGIDKFSIR